MTTLAVRDDRIGDLVLTLPSLAMLAAAGDRLEVAASVRNAEVLLHDRRVAALHLLPVGGRARVRAFRRLLRRVRPVRVVFFRSRFPLGWVAWFAGVPRRVGPLSNVDGLAYSHGLRQRRSRGDRSEASFGAELARLATDGRLAEGGASSDPSLALPVRYRERARRWVAQVWRPAGALRVGVHPGSGGSARNWSAERYARLVRTLAADDRISLLVTASPAEEALARRVAGPGVPVHVGWAGPLAHAALLAELDLLIVGSTGSMHLAAAVGTATLSMFSAIRAESPRRWGALGAHAVALTPDVPECERCIGERCPVWDCLERISEAQVVARVREHLR